MIVYNCDIVESQRFNKYRKKASYALKAKKRKIFSIAKKHEMSCLIRKDGIELRGRFYSNKELDKALKDAKKGKLYWR